MASSGHVVTGQGRKVSSNVFFFRSGDVTGGLDLEERT